MRHRFLLVALIAVSTILVPLSFAANVQGDSVTCVATATICWDNTSGGSWEASANWILPGGGAAGRMPTASDDVDLPEITPYTVLLNSVQTVHSIHIGASNTLQCNSGCTLTILAHTTVLGADGDIEGTLSISGNVINKGALVNLSQIDINGGTFVNFNSLDTSDTLGDVTNNWAFVEKCYSQLIDASTPPSHVHGSGTLVTETPCPTSVPTASGSQVSGTASFSSSLGGFTSLTSTAASSVSPAPPAGLTFPAGLFSFTISGLRADSTVTVTITLPSPLPAGPFSYWKLKSGAWIQYPSASLDVTRTIITLTLTADASGTVTDPGGPSSTAPIIPEYPLGLPLLAIFVIFTYGLIKRRTVNPKDI